ncbi:MAG: hypothetical protein ACREMQ_01925 [Longimicrobiales bacterium]
MNSQVSRLPRNARRGSKPRCHWLTHGPREEVARRLTALIAPWATVSAADAWMPEGFDRRSEAQLHTANRLLDASMCEALGRWWLPRDHLDARTPNWDLAATCTMGSRRAVLLVEAKAHDHELLHESRGRPLITSRSADQASRRASHRTIERAIAEARDGLNEATGLTWGISRDSHYQLSNRFAWAWKLAALGVPVVLVYLGFAGAREMADKGEPFASGAAWEALVKEHAAEVVPESAWNAEWRVNGVPFVPIIRAFEQPLNGEHAA